MRASSETDRRVAERHKARLPRASVLFLCTTLVATATTDAVAEDREGLTERERQRLAAGELITRPLHMRRGDLDLIGGSSWQVIDAPPLVVWRALQDTERYSKMLPGVKRANLVAQQGSERCVYLRQGAWPFLRSYYAILRSDPTTRTLHFELDRERPHELNAGWGFARVQSYEASKTLMTFGVLADVGHGLLAAVGRSVVQTWMLKVPATVKRFLEHGGRDLY